MDRPERGRGRAIEQTDPLSFFNPDLMGSLPNVVVPDTSVED
ncbi:hypothetical protein [Streptomyces sp. NPDC051286]